MTRKVYMVGLAAAAPPAKEGVVEGYWDENSFEMACFLELTLYGLEQLH